MPAVQKAVKKVAFGCSTCGEKSSDDTPAEGNTLKENPAEENTVKEELEVKPLVVCKKPPKNRDGDPVLTVEMKLLKFYPAKKRLPTARRGKPFRCGIRGGGVLHSVSEDEKKWVVIRIVLVLLLVMMKVISEVMIIFPKKGMQVLKLMIHHMKCGLQQKVL